MTLQEFEQFLHAPFNAERINGFVALPADSEIQRGFFFERTTPTQIIYQVAINGQLVDEPIPEEIDYDFCFEWGNLAKAINLGIFDK